MSEYADLLYPGLREMGRYKTIVMDPPWPTGYSGKTKDVFFGLDIPTITHRRYSRDSNGIINGRRLHRVHLDGDGASGSASRINAKVGHSIYVRDDLDEKWRPQSRSLSPDIQSREGGCW